MRLTSALAAVALTAALVAAVAAVAPDAAHGHPATLALFSFAVSAFRGPLP